MEYLVLGAFAYIATSAAAFYLFLLDHKRSRRELGYVLTNGDVVFCLFASIIPIVSLPVALLITATSSYGAAVNNWASRPSRFFSGDDDTAEGKE